MTHTVVGLFNSRSDAQTAMQELIQAGFIQDHIDISNRSQSDTDANYDSGYSDTSTTGTTGTTGTTSNQGIGDRISNFFGSLFDDETTASTYTNAAYDADAILTVQADSAERASQAADILDRNGAMDIDNNGADYDSTGYGTQNYAGTSQTSGMTNTTGTTGTADYDTTSNAANLRGETNVQDREVIPVVEENLEVGKRAVERGGARIRSRIVEKPVEASVRLREEHVVVNRHPVNRAVTDADINNFQQGDIEITEHAEVPVVSKQARVVEEVEIGKTVEEHDETVRDTVRRTDVDVEELRTDVTDADDDLHTGSRRANT